MQSVINLLLAKQQEWDTEKARLIAQRENAVMALYKIRNYVDDQIKKKQPYDNIMVEVHKMLKAETPHGADMKVDA
jgi:hypothetical protein